ncbi:polysaccharide lyase 8 family protein [Streptomyces sp. NPDC004014]
MSTGPSRRALLLAAALTAAAPAPAARAAAGADPFDTLRLRWLDIALGTGYDPAAEPYAARLARLGGTARDFHAGMAPAAGSLWPGHPFDPPAGITFSYGRLWTMAQAYVQPGTGVTGDDALLAGLLRGLDHLSESVYNPATTRYGNWWEWQIGSPRLLTDITAALHDRLGADRVAAACAAVDHFIPDTMLTEYSGTSTGANRVDLCRSVALRGVLGRSADRLALARDALSPVFPHVTEGDGLYADGSFVQHAWVAYSGTYGQVLLDGLGRLLALLAGSPWEITDPARRNVLDSVEHAFAPLIHGGLVMDCVNGRAISRGLLLGDDLRVMRSDHYHGQALIAAVALLAGGAGGTERERWYGLVKGWIERDTVTPLLTAPQFGVADLARLHAVAASPVPAAPEPLGHRLFPAMERAVHRGPRFTAALSMAGDRIAHYECGNGENPRGWHTGSGMLSWWPAGRSDAVGRAAGPADVRPGRAPLAAGPVGQAPGGNGGAGQPVPVGQHLKGLGSTLEARKSCFFLADAVVCLGAGISCADGVPVETVVDNRNLGEDGAQTFARGPGWAHLEDHGGWLLPRGGALRTLREDRTGSWSDINTTSTDERRTRRWQTLWLDHGTDPDGADYVYVLMPGATRGEVAARAADRHWLRVLANDARRQAVAVPSLGLTAVNSWAAGTAGGLSAGAGASVLVRRRGRSATLWISEPPRTGTPLEIVWDRPVRSAVHADDTVDVHLADRRTRLRVTPGMACAVHRCEVILG